MGFLYLFAPDTPKKDANAAVERKCRKFFLHSADVDPCTGIDCTENGTAL